MLYCRLVVPMDERSVVFQATLLGVILQVGVLTGRRSILGPNPLLLGLQLGLVRSLWMVRHCGRGEGHGKRASQAFITSSVDV